MKVLDIKARKVDRVEELDLCFRKNPCLVIGCLKVPSSFIIGSEIGNEFDRYSLHAPYFSLSGQLLLCCLRKTKHTSNNKEL